MRGVANYLSQAGHPLTQQIINSMKLLSQADFVVVSQRDPDRYLTTLPIVPAELPADEHVVDDWQSLRLSSPIDVAREPYLASGFRLRDRDGRVTGTVYILYPERTWRDARWAAIQPSLVLGVFGGLASLVVAVLMSSRVARRIQELERRTRLIAAGDFSPLPLPRRNDELRDLSRSVNQMAEQLARLEETVKETERLRLLGQVGGGLAHQLRNSVTGARLALQLHARGCNGQGDAEALDVALHQLNLMEANLNRFLDLGRSQTERRELCDLSQLIDQAVLLLRPQCRHAGIDLRWTLADHPWPARGDAVQLGHLFLNVITNAVEAAGSGGRVAINLRRSGPDDGPPRAIVEIVDSGPGPPPEIVDRLFQPFVTGKREGVGLGLAVARRVAESHQGRISWRREHDQTWFQIEIPLAEQ